MTRCYGGCAVGTGRGAAQKHLRVLWTLCVLGRPMDGANLNSICR